MKSRSPVTRQGWWVLCGAGSAQRQDARLQRPRHSPSCVFVWPAPALCCAPDCSLSGHQPLYPHHHTSVGNTANGTYNHHLTYNLYLAGLVGLYCLNPESTYYILDTRATFCPQLLSIRQMEPIKSGCLVRVRAQ